MVGGGGNRKDGRCTWIADWVQLSFAGEPRFLEEQVLVGGSMALGLVMSKVYLKQLVNACHDEVLSWWLLL